MNTLSELTECPYCGNEYKRLSVHLLYCPSKPENEEIDTTVSDTDTEYTMTMLPEDKEAINELLKEIEEDIELIELEETPESPCPYLYIIAGNACASCRGLSCLASSDKKISDLDYCKQEWPDCLEYETARDSGKRPICPYFGLPPPDKPNCCSGIYCYATNKAIRVPKKCITYGDCGRFLSAKGDGVPFHRAKVT